MNPVVASPCPSAHSALSPAILAAPSTALRDIIARFGTDPSYQLPKAFFDDFVTVSGVLLPRVMLLCNVLLSTA